MTSANSVSWNKIITVCSVFGIPLFSIMAWLVIGGTQLVDKVDAQGLTLKSVVDKVDALNTRVDTLSQRQKDNKRDIDHKFEILDLRHSTIKAPFRNVTERYINGKLAFIPVK